MSFDIDIDVGNRDRLLELITHTPASMDRDGTITKHNTGIYVNPIPADPLTLTLDIAAFLACILLIYESITSMRLAYVFDT